MGFDMVFAPDADVTIGPADPVIGARSAGSRPALVARHVVAAGQGYQDAGVVPVLKHFPGHGSLTTDSHLALPVQKRTREQLDRIDLRPFREAIAEDAPAVMIGHIDVRAIDPGRPASVSRKVITGLLRHDLGFTGLVVTDSLGMDGVEKQYPRGRGAVAALRAGADVALMPDDPEVARTAIIHAVRGGRLERSRLEDAATRMLATLIHRNAGDYTPAAPSSRQGASTRLSRAALTSVAGPCSGRLVREGIRVVGPDLPGRPAPRRRAPGRARGRLRHQGGADPSRWQGGPRPGRGRAGHAVRPPAQRRAGQDRDVRRQLRGDAQPRRADARTDDGPRAAAGHGARPAPDRLSVGR